MTIKELEDKVKAAEERVNKIKSTIEKHKNKLNKKINNLNKIFEEIGEDITYEDVRYRSNWVIDYHGHPFYYDILNISYDIDYVIEDIKNCQYKLKDAEKVLENWKEKLNNEKVKQQYIKDSIPQEIKEFMLQWKNNTLIIMQEMAEQFIIDRDMYRQEKNMLIFEYIQEHKDEFRWLDTSDYDPGHWYEGDVHSYKMIKEIQSMHEYITITNEFKSKYEHPLFRNYKSKHFDDEWLEKELTQEMNNRLVDLMSKVSKITGIITGADLHVTYGDLNGVVYGEEGNAKVTTVSAGGYNIQIWHLRCLVKPLK